MAKASLSYYEFKSSDHSEEVERHTIKSLVLQIAEPYGLTDHDVQAIIDLAPGTSTSIPNVGVFRRLR